MIAASCFKDKKVAVFGLGMSGIGTAHSLLAGGAKVTVWDDHEKACRVAKEAGLPVKDLRKQDWKTLDALILAPGVPLTHPEPAWPVRLAHEAGVEVIGDTEIFFRQKRFEKSKAKIIGITGTNGKSTTTALVAHILQENGLRVQMGGNIGRAVLDLEAFEDDMIYVIELSSYQIDLTPSPDIFAAVLLNLTPDHIDRHGTFEHYGDVKARIFEDLPSDGLAIAALSTPSAKDKLCALETPAQKIWVGRLEDVKCCMGAGIVLRENHSLLPVASKDEVQGSALVAGYDNEISLAGIGSLRGIHNAENAGIALAIARHWGISKEDFLKAAKTFPGLPHRMEEVGRIGDVLFINDSKATNAESTLHALRSFENIYWIVGGLPKEGGIDILKQDWGSVRKAYLIGEAAPVFAQTLEGRLEYQVSGTLEQAVLDIWQDLADLEERRAAVLLSPACASFDQFPNFMMRGDAFREAVRVLQDTQNADVS